MKKSLISLFALSLAVLSTGASAKEETAQQGRMASCNKDAADKKGDERKAFMKDCLSAKPAAAAAADAKPMTAQQTRMKTCNADAKGKTGDERKAFMKECLSAKKS